MWTEADFKAANFQPLTKKQLSLLDKLEPGVDHSKMSFVTATRAVRNALDRKRFLDFDKRCRDKMRRGEFNKFEGCSKANWAFMEEWL